MKIELRFSESKFPKPSSIAKKFGFGKFDTLTNADRIAKEDMNFSIPDVSSSGQDLSSYTMCVLIFLPSTWNNMLKSTICPNILFTSSVLLSTSKSVLNQ